MKNRRLTKVFKVGLFLLLLIGLFEITAWSSGTGSTLLCQKCHVMKPQTMTWSESSHRNIPCATCHINPGFEDRFKFSLRLILKALLVLSRSYVLPIHTGKSIRNDACLQCHTPNRTVTPRNDLIVLHNQHYQNGVYCIDCHKGVTHGQLTERNQTIDGDFDKWTSEFAKQEMALGNLRIGMKECMGCHQSQGKGPPSARGVMRR